MASIHQLEKLLRPYSIGAGASGPFTDYEEFRNKGVLARVDEADSRPYKEVLESAAKELGLLEDSK